MRRCVTVVGLAWGLIAPAYPARSAYAGIIDLTPGGASRGTINGAIFEFGKQRGGTGILEPFVRIQANGSEHGYNTSSASVPFDEKTGPWTRDLRLNEIPVITKAGVRYLEFLLDINENRGNGHEFLSLDALRLYTSSAPGRNTTDFDLLGTLRYDLDAGEDNTILLNYANAPGSGWTDMTAYVPVDNFAGVDPSHYLYVYSQFGLRPVEGSGSNRKDWGTSDGFEEWAVELFPDTVYIPEPVTLGFLAAGAPAMLWRRRKRHGS